MISQAFIYYFAIYLAIIFFVSFYHSRKIKTSDAYLVADRKTGLWGVIGSMVATSCGAATFIGFVGMGFVGGISGFFTGSYREQYLP